MNKYLISTEDTYDGYKVSIWHDGKLIGVPLRGLKTRPTKEQLNTAHFAFMYGLEEGLRLASQRVNSVMHSIELEPL